MSIYSRDREVIEDDVHQALEPLIRRASRFGPYFWLSVLAGIVSLVTVEAATGSYLAGFAFMVAGVMVMDDRAADREYTIEKWLKEVVKGRMA